MERKRPRRLKKELAPVSALLPAHDSGKLTGNVAVGPQITHEQGHGRVGHHPAGAVKGRVDEMRLVVRVGCVHDRVRVVAAVDGHPGDDSTVAVRSVIAKDHAPERDEDRYDQRDKE